jgi:hypothetical protein
MTATRPSRPAICSVRVACYVLSFLLLSSLSCYSADVVFIRSSGGSSQQLQELKIATEFYGLNLKIVTPSADDSGLALSGSLGSKSTVAVTIAADALTLVTEQALFQALKQRPGGSLPVLILGVTPETDGSLLRAWSGGAVTACRRLERQGQPQYIIGGLAGVTQQLTGSETPLQSKDAIYLELNNPSDVHRVTMLRDGHEVFPVFIETPLQGLMVFMDCTRLSSDNAAAKWNAFVAITPALMFIRYCAGERGWHALHHYANLTVDDPWLREPYGSLYYRGLLGEMEKHGFHTTIAFIPWNYDRSEPQVASLIRAHPNRFSISIHGDNHDHKEFTDYQSKPLALQIEDLKQATGRMDRFQALTGIPYDKVMVFPHSIAPEETLAALKNNNYLATVNSSNVPMDAVRPSGLSFDLRATTLSFARFSSIRRYSVEGPVPASLIALNAFLDNPLLFYCHQSFFASGIDAFDAEADYVDKLQPDTRWRRLGEIVRHLYVVKLRDDDNYDVLSFAGTISLENVSSRNSLFYVRKEESDPPAMVSVDGQSWPYVLRDGYLEMQIPVESGKTRNISIAYGNAQEATAVGIEKRSFRVYCLRMASDFRDIIIARYASGRSLIRLYDEHGGPLGFVLMGVSALLALFILGLWRLRVMMKSRAVGPLRA